jgi:CheY-like chemotaxis protein
MQIVRVRGYFMQQGKRAFRRVMIDETGIVFVVENNADHIFQLEQAFRKANITAQLKIARYGNEAILYLKGVGIYSDRITYPLPHVVLLDLDLPDGSATSVLGWIRQQPELFGVQIFALTYAPMPNQIEEARKLGVAGWFLKGDIPAIVQTIHALFHPDEARSAA